MTLDNDDKDWIIDLINDVFTDFSIPPENANAEDVISIQEACSRARAMANSQRP